ncbi:MAG: hypothetical protein KDD61_12260, partial [Bdellovibrionales bacterium]|nr:hypothetical protein [Bdellovibrionales bacterium]
MKWKQVILVFLITLIFLEVGLQFIAFKFHRRAPDSFRSDDIRKIRILAIGESTTAKETAYRPNTDWPYLLEKRLKEKGYSVVVYNGGRGATTTSFLLSRLPHQIQKYNPHIVISMMGINDHNLFWLKEQSVFGGMGFWRNFRVIRLLAYLVSDKKSWVSSSMKLTRFGERDGRWFRSHLQMERVQEWITEISPQSKERVFNEIEGALKGISIEQQAQFYAFLAEKIDRTHQKLPFFNETVEELYVRSWDLSPKVHFVAEDLIDLIIRKGGA